MWLDGLKYGEEAEAVPIPVTAVEGVAIGTENQGKPRYNIRWPVNLENCTSNGNIYEEGVPLILRLKIGMGVQLRDYSFPAFLNNIKNYLRIPRGRVSDNLQGKQTWCAGSGVGATLIRLWLSKFGREVSTRWSQKTMITLEIRG